MMSSDPKIIFSIFVLHSVKGKDISVAKNKIGSGKSIFFKHFVCQFLVNNLFMKIDVLLKIYYFFQRD